MRFLRLRLGADLLSSSPSATHGEVLNIRYATDGTILELYSVEGDLEKILNQLESTPSTDHFEHLGSLAGRHFIFHHGRPSEEVQMMIELMDAHGLLVVLPLQFDETGATVDLIGDSESLRSVYDQFPPEIRQQTTIEHVGDYVPDRPGIMAGLTERQREVLEAAVSVGYYATPRTGTAEDVAEAVDCAPSTASEHLRKIEARIFNRLVSGVGC